MTSTEKRIEEIDAAKEAAHRHICDLARNGDYWTMSIPVRQTDSDMVLQKPLDDIDWLITELKSALRRERVLREACKGHLQSMTAINEHFGYKFTQPLLKFREVLNEPAALESADKMAGGV